MGAGAVAVESAVQGVDGGGGSRYPEPGTLPPRSGRPCVLILEDEAAIRELLVELLAVEGFRVASAESALGGLGLVRRLRPAVVVLDLGLPYVSGVHFLAELRADPDPLVRAVPVVVVSALTETLPPDRWAQVSAVLAKPVRLRVLADTVRAASGGAPAPR
jgi:two-component system phosphate regulon response regulator PhoB